MYHPNPSFDLPRGLIYDLVDHAQKSLMTTALELVPMGSRDKPLSQMKRGFEGDLIQDTSKEFRFIMPHDGKKSTLKLYWSLADPTYSNKMWTKTVKTLTGRMGQLFPGAVNRRFRSTQKPTNRNWYNHQRAIRLYINRNASYNDLVDFLVANAQEAVGGINYLRYHLTSMIAHEITHALDVLLSCPFGSLDPTDRVRYKKEYDYYYNCDIEVRANQNALFWVMEDLKTQNPEKVEDFLGHSVEEDNLRNMQILAPIIDMGGANPQTKKIFLQEIKEWQSANREFFGRTLFKSPPKKKPVKKPPKRKPTKRKPTKRKPLKKKRLEDARAKYLERKKK
jgi:hypothetical protein